MGEEREAEENEQEESDKEELGENKGELDEGNKKKVCDSYSSISILDVCDIILAYYNKECSAYIIQFCVYAEAKEIHHISCSRKS